MSEQRGKLSYMAFTLFGITWLFYFMLKNTIPVDVGDGLMHFFIAQATWEKPILFLHHWGKPLFSFLSSPFAQFGLNGMVTFNILVYFATSIGMFRLFKELKVNLWIASVFPLLILIPNDYSMTILAGLTEPLFNLFVVFSALFLVKRKWVYFAIIVSFMPFLRSEGQLPVVLAIILLVYFKQWKTIPYLATGFVLYAIVGFLAISDFWWYFTTSPYQMDNDIYGVGTWDHYLLSYRNYIGNPGLYAIIIGVPMAIYLLIRKKWELLHFDLAFYSGGIFIGIVALHSYFWATGQNASIGLTRIATQGMPLFLGLMIYYISVIKWSNTKIGLAVFLVASFGLSFALKNTKRFPQEPSALELLVLKTPEIIKQQLKKGRSVYYHFPLLPYKLNENPMLDSKNTFFYSGGNFNEDCNSKFKSGDLLFWDSHFGPQEMGLGLEVLAAQKRWKLVKEYSVGSESVKIFQFFNDETEVDSEPSVTMKLDNSKLEIGTSNEYTDILNSKQQLEGFTQFTADFVANVDGLRIVFDNGNLKEYFSSHTRKGISQHLTFQLTGEKEYKLYIWNPDKEKGAIEITNQHAIKKTLHPMMD